MVLSGSYGNKCMPTGIVEAERIQWAGRDVILWCSKLGDYMLTAPQRLVLLQCPNCYAIFVFLLHSGQTPLVMSLGYMMWFPTQRQHQQKGPSSSALQLIKVVLWQVVEWWVICDTSDLFTSVKDVAFVSGKELSCWTSAMEIYTSLTCHQLILIKV